MAELTLNGIPLDGQPVYKFTLTLPVTDETIEDSEWMRTALKCNLWLMTQAPRPITDEEALAGQQTCVHGDHDHTISIGWRADQERLEAEARREAEMAACPYVECTCGHHEDDY